MATAVLPDLARSMLQKHPQFVEVMIHNFLFSRCQWTVRRDFPEVGYGVLMDMDFLMSVSSSQRMTANVDWAFGTGSEKIVLAIETFT